MNKKAKKDKKLIKVPILNNDELNELGEVMYSNDGDELLEKRFWKKVYAKRELKYPEGEQKCLGAK